MFSKDVVNKRQQQQQKQKEETENKFDSFTSVTATDHNNNNNNEKTTDTASKQKQSPRAADAANNNNNNMQSSSSSSSSSSASTSPANTTPSKRRMPTLNFQGKGLFSRSDHGGDKSSKLTEQEEKGYTDQDVNRAVDYWCKVVIKDFEKQRNSPKLRESIWKVGIPTRLRGRVWPLAIGNALSITKALYESFAERAKQMQAIESEKKKRLQQQQQMQHQNNKMKLKGQRSRSNSLNDGNADQTPPAPLPFEEDVVEDNNVEDMQMGMVGNESTIKYISVDLTRTFPTLSYFQDDGPLNETLHSLLQTYCFFRPDRGYIQGMSYLAANLLLYMDSYHAFVCFCNLLNMPFFHCFLSLDDEKMAPRIDIFNYLFEYNENALYKKFAEHMISPKEYFLDWAISLFTKKLQISVASRVWDLILIFGEMEIYRCCVAILKCLAKPLLLNHDDNIRKKLKTLPNSLKEAQLIAAMKQIKVPKKLKQQLHKLNHAHTI